MTTPCFAPDGVLSFDARYMLQEDDGTLILMQNRGFLWGRSPDTMQRLRDMAFAGWAGGGIPASITCAPPRLSRSRPANTTGSCATSSSGWVSVRRTATWSATSRCCRSVWRNHLCGLRACPRRTSTDALKAFAAIVGPEWVLVSEEDRHSYLDAFAPGNPDEHASSAGGGTEVRGGSAGDRQGGESPSHPAVACLEPGGTSRMEDPRPVLRGSVVLDLKRMNGSWRSTRSWVTRWWSPA